MSLPKDDAYYRAEARAIGAEFAAAKKERRHRTPKPLAPVADARDTFKATDSGNAEFFTRCHGDDVRFDHRRQGWLEWTEHRWTPDCVAQIRQRAKGAMRRRLAEALARNDTADAKFALRSESRAGIESLLYLAQAEPPIADPGDAWDADPMLLGAPNGVIDLRTGTRRPGTRADRITKNVTTPFDPDARCPRWEECVWEIFGGTSDLVDFVHRAIGYSLTGDTTGQCLFMCHGTGANGKSTLLNTLKKVLGDYAWNMPFATIEMRDRHSIPNDLAALDGRRFVVASETNDGTRLNESRIKALTGGDPVTARYLHQEFFMFDPVAKFWLAVNHKPVVRDDSHGFWRRVRLIPFTRTFPVDDGLAEALMAEAPGILAWAVRGCVEWQQHGLTPPAIVLAATEEYKHDSDPLADFLSEAIEMDAESCLWASELFGAYTDWAKSRSIPERERLTSTRFGRMATERFRNTRPNGRKQYHGLARRLS
jgi:putative DNA primase/helicase